MEVYTMQYLAERMNLKHLYDRVDFLLQMVTSALWISGYCEILCDGKLLNYVKIKFQTEHEIIYISFNCVCIHNTVIYHEKPD